MADEKCDTSEYSQSIGFTGPNSGSYTWLISDKSLIRNILNAENRKLFESEPFVMRNMSWSILLYPNGNKTERTGDVMIYLKLLSIPPIIDTVVVCYSISCDKTFAACSSMVHFTHTNDEWGFRDRSGTLLLSEWKSMNADKLSVTVKVNVIKIILNKMGMHNSESIGSLPHSWINKKQSFPTQWHFEYKFDRNTINRFKKSNVGKSFTSNIIDNTWQLKIYPNGNVQDYQGNVGVCLSLCLLPPNTAEIVGEYTIKWYETSDECSYEATFKAHDNSFGDPKLITLSQLLSLNELTFIVDINILSMKEEENIECIVSDSKIIDRIFALYSDDNYEEHKLDSLNIQQQLTEKYKEIQELSSRMISMQNIIKELRNEITSNDKTVKELRNKINNLESYVFAEKEENEEKENDINNVTTSILSLQKQMKEMQKDINNNKQQNNQNAGQKQLKSWFINVVKMGEYFDIFVEHGFEDFDSVKYVTANELTLMGITKIGHKMKLLRCIATLNHENEGNTAHQ